ncbi:MAG TPA: hypothetical protein VKD72_35480, partial [Gemmataceae bacterium]|nr:hypothetical protein [Gemmataceae bacterium]
HHGAIDLMRQVAPKTTVHSDRRFADNGRVICSAGIAAGIDMSLHVVARLLEREVAEKTARQMEYPLERSADMIRGIHHVQLTVPSGAEEAHVLLFEPATTLNTGNVRDERTVEQLERI